MLKKFSDTELVLGSAPLGAFAGAAWAHGQSLPELSDMAATAGALIAMGMMWWHIVHDDDDSDGGEDVTDRFTAR